MKHDRFHGRVAGTARGCAWPGCAATGEFRAPGGRPSGFDGPGEFRWFCLDHIREFNAGYDFFRGMSVEDILAAQSPISGWARESRAFRADGGVGQGPRWADFSDPLDAIGAHMRDRAGGAARRDGIFSPEEQRALDVLGLAANADRRALRQRYSELVRRFHPDRNGGDRSHESRLRAVIEAWQLLKKARGFA